MQPGGSVYFLARTFENLGIGTTIVSPYGFDFPKKILGNTRFYPPEPTANKTLIFENTYRQNEREQKAKHYLLSGFEKIGKLPANLWRSKNIVVVAPILDNMNLAQIKAWKKNSTNSLFILNAQGFFRQLLDNGKVRPKIWRNAYKVVKLFNLIVVSEKDWISIEKLAFKWSLSGPIVIVTKEEKGCSVYQEGKRLDSKGFKVNNIIDATGSGDIFAAAFSFAYLKSGDIKSSADFANSAAGLSLRFFKNKLKYKYRDIIEFAKVQGRSINL